MSLHERTRPGLGIIEPCVLEDLKMQTLLVDLILAAVVGAVFLIALRGRKIGFGKGSPDSEPLAKFFNLFWGWGEYPPGLVERPV
jgi:hypothetical protein